MKPKPLLSVVLSSYNYSRYLADSINAVLAQSLEVDEFIIIDDGSTDDSPLIAERFQQDHSKIELIQHKKNQGIVTTLNQGIQVANGKYILFVAADDIIFQDLALTAVKMLDENQNAGIFSAKTILINEKGEKIGNWPSEDPHQEGFIKGEQVKKILKQGSFWFTGNTAVFKRSVLLEAGGFRKELGPLADLFTALVLALKYGCCFSSSYLAGWRREQMGYSMSSLTTPKLAHKYISTAKDIIAREYPSLFPRVYIKRWERQYLYASYLRGVKIQADNVVQTLTIKKNRISPKHPYGHRLIPILRIILSLPLNLFRIFLLIRYQQLSWVKIKRRFSRGDYIFESLFLFK